MGKKRKCAVGESRINNPLCLTGWQCGGEKEVERGKQVCEKNVARRRGGRKEGKERERKGREGENGVIKLAVKFVEDPGT